MPEVMFFRTDDRFFTVTQSCCERGQQWYASERFDADGAASRYLWDDGWKRHAITDETARSKDYSPTGAYCATREIALSRLKRAVPGIRETETDEWYLEND